MADMSWYWLRPTQLWWKCLSYKNVYGSRSRRAFDLPVLCYILYVWFQVREKVRPGLVQIRYHRHTSVTSVVAVLVLFPCGT